MVLTLSKVDGLPAPSFFERMRGRGGVKQMAIGLEHAAFLTHSGKVFTVGGNEWGQCGHRPPAQKGPMGALEERERIEVEKATEVEFPEACGKIVQIATGGRHTLTLDENHFPFSFGDDRRIQLGLGDTRSSGADERHSMGVLKPAGTGVPKKMRGQMARSAHYRYYDAHMQFMPTPTVPPVVYNRPPLPNPSFVVCGEDFTLAVTRDSPDWYSDEQETNLVYACGENGHGQCGRTMQAQQHVWVAVRLPKLSKVVGLSCGQGHAVALLQTGELFSWGLNSNGQAGIGNRAMAGQPVEVFVDPDALAAVKEAALAQAVAAAVAAAEAAGEDVNDARKRVKTPKVALPWKVKSINCGFRSSMAIVEVEE